MTYHQQSERASLCGPWVHFVSGLGGFILQRPVLHCLRTEYFVISEERVSENFFSPLSISSPVSQVHQQGRKNVHLSYLVCILPVFLRYHSLGLPDTPPPCFTPNNSQVDEPFLEMRLKETALCSQAGTSP